ncbi:unnamed protein product [Brachionus calyciflorus]|uniref:Uncharacterized protein n=1 Tax=Brachionus calyciflorus TaxID=104777 RepID=A0A814GWK8_9BILA|nr:unnamed protein product [Brachionus calyciflorus]
MVLTFKNERKSFSSDFTNILTKKFQALGSKCLLKSDFNWFRKENSRKNGDFWVGKYTCLVCKNHFKARWIQEEMMTIIIEGNMVDHGISEEKSFNPIFGEKRKLLAQEIVAKGISGFRIENSLSGNDMSNIQKLDEFQMNLIIEISQKIIELIQMSDDLIADYQKFLSITEVMKTHNLSFLDLPYDICTKLSALEEFYEVDIGVNSGNNVMYRTASIETINSTNDKENLFLFDWKEQNDIFPCTNFEMSRVDSVKLKFKKCKNDLESGDDDSITGDSVFSSARETSNSDENSNHTILLSSSRSNSTAPSSYSIDSNIRKPKKRLDNDFDSEESNEAQTEKKPIKYQL